MSEAVALATETRSILKRLGKERIWDFLHECVQTEDDIEGFWREHLDSARRADEGPHDAEKDAIIGALRKQIIANLYTLHKFSCMLWDQLEESCEYEIDEIAYWTDIRDQTERDVAAQKKREDAAAKKNE
jgi:hypothetical protein